MKLPLLTAVRLKIAECRTAHMEEMRGLVTREDDRAPEILWRTGAINPMEIELLEPCTLDRHDRELPY